MFAHSLCLPLLAACCVAPIHARSFWPWSAASQQTTISARVELVPETDCSFNNPETVLFAVDFKNIPVPRGSKVLEYLKSTGTPQLNEALAPTDVIGFFADAILQQDTLSDPQRRKSPSSITDYRGNARNVKVLQKVLNWLTVRAHDGPEMIEEHLKWLLTSQKVILADITKDGHSKALAGESESNGWVRIQVPMSSVYDQLEMLLDLQAHSKANEAITPASVVSKVSELETMLNVICLQYLTYRDRVKTDLEDTDLGLTSARRRYVGFHSILESTLRATLEDVVRHTSDFCGKTSDAAGAENYSEGLSRILTLLAQGRVAFEKIAEGELSLPSEGDKIQSQKLNIPKFLSDETVALLCHTVSASALCDTTKTQILNLINAELKKRNSE